VQQASLELEVRKECPVHLAAAEVLGHVDQSDPAAVLERLGALAVQACGAK